MSKKTLVIIMCYIIVFILLAIIPSTQAIDDKNLIIQECESYHHLKKCTIKNYSPYCYENNAYYKLYLYYYTNNSKSHTSISERIRTNESINVFFINKEDIKKVELAYVWGKKVQFITSKNINKKDNDNFSLILEYIINLLKQYFFFCLFILISLILLFYKKHKKTLYRLLILLAICSFMYHHIDYVTTKYVFTVDTYEMMDNTKNAMDTNELFFGQINPLNGGIYAFLPVLSQMMGIVDSDLFSILKIIPFILSIIFFLMFYKISNHFIKSKYISIVIAYSIMFIPVIFDNTTISHRMGYMLWLFPLAFYILIKTYSNKSYTIPFLILYIVIFISHKTTLILLILFSIPYIFLRNSYEKKSTFNILLFMTIIGWIVYILYQHPLFLVVNIVVTTILLFDMLPIKKNLKKFIFTPISLFVLIVLFFVLRPDYKSTLFHYITIYDISFSILTIILVGCYILILNKFKKSVDYKEIFLALSIVLIPLINLTNIPLIGNYPMINRNRLNILITIWILLFIGNAIFRIKQTLEKRNFKVDKIFIFVISIILLILMVTQFPAIEDQWKYKYNLQGEPYFPEHERLQLIDFLNKTYTQDINVFVIGIHVKPYLEHSLYKNKKIKKFLDPISDNTLNLTNEQRNQANKTFLIKYMPLDIEIIVIEKFRYEILSRNTNFYFMENYEKVYESSLFSVYDKK